MLRKYLQWLQRCYTKSIKLRLSKQKRVKGQKVQQREEQNYKSQSNNRQKKRRTVVADDI